MGWGGGSPSLQEAWVWVGGWGWGVKAGGQSKGSERAPFFCGPGAPIIVRKGRAAKVVAGALPSKPCFATLPVILQLSPVIIFRLPLSNQCSSRSGCSRHDIAAALVGHQLVSAAGAGAKQQCSCPPLFCWTSQPLRPLLSAKRAARCCRLGFSAGPGNCRGPRLPPAAAGPCNPCATFPVSFRSMRMHGGLALKLRTALGHVTRGRSPGDGQEQQNSAECGSLVLHDPRE